MLSLSPGRNVVAKAGSSCFATTPTSGAITGRPNVNARCNAPEFNTFRYGSTTRSAARIQT
jgi:hypothetical protein